VNPRLESKAAPLRGDLCRIIRERIVRGDFAPGARIKEVPLAADLDTSRTPLREALITLEQEGFVRSELAHGFTVEPLSGREIRETYPILWTLETLALRTSGSAIYSLLDDLSRINAELARSQVSEDRLRLDTQWHETLLSRCPNRRLQSMISALRTAMRRYEYLFMDDTGPIEVSVQQHQQIIAALAERNIESAVQILMENWRVGMELLLVRLGEP